MHLTRTALSCFCVSRRILPLQIIIPRKRLGTEMWLSVSAEWNLFDRWSLLDHSLPTLFAPSRRVAVGRQLTNAHETTTSGESSGQATNLDERMVVAFAVHFHLTLRGSQGPARRSAPTVVTTRPNGWEIGLRDGHTYTATRWYTEGPTGARRRPTEAPP